MRAQTFAVFPANQFHGRRKQDLLAQNVFQQKTFALIIADLGVRLRNGDFFRPAIDTQGPVQQIKGPVYRMRHRIEAAGTTYFEGGVESANHTDVIHVLLVAAMLDDQLRPAFGLQRAYLAEIETKINRSGLEVLVKLQFLEFQIANPNEHSSTCLTP